MGVYTSLSPFEFEQAFKDMGRDYYSSDGYQYLYEMLDELDTELDVISICCDWTEYDNSEQLIDDYGYLVDGADGEVLDNLIDKLENHTTIVRLGYGGYLLQAF